jgi:CelD/BcsL family acetyltransferase involved in cellulose biosynthesis
MLTVSEVTTADGLHDLQPEWDDLFRRSHGASIFQTWEWVSTCWKYFGRRKQLAIVSVRDGDRLVGLAPLETARMYGLPLRRLQSIGTGSSDYLDFLIDADSTEGVLREICRWMVANRHRWDLVDLQNLSESSSTRRLWDDSREGSELTVSIFAQEQCPYLPLADTWEETASLFGKKMRYNLRYYERLMSREFRVQLGSLDSHEIDEGMDAFFSLHAKRWRRRWLPGMLVGASRQGFHREVAWLCHKRGWLRLHGLRLDGRLQAALYCFACKGKAYYYLGGFEPKLSRFSLGTVLTGFAIRDAIECGCSEFDFLRGDEAYKSRWTSEHRANGRIVVSQNTPQSRLAAAICRLEQRIEHRVKHELHKRIGAG